MQANAAFRSIGTYLKKALGRVPLAFIPSVGMGSQPVYPDINFKNIVQFGLYRNELVYACIQMSASTGAFVTLKVYDKKTNDELPDHPLRQLIAHPNPYMTESDFWGMTIINQKLAGRAYWEKTYRTDGSVSQLWPVRPDYLQPIRGDGKAFLTEYEFGVNGIDTRRIKASSIIDFTLYDPLDIYKGLPPLKVAFRMIDVDNAATDYLKLFWERGTEVPGIYTTKQKLRDEDIGTLRRRISERYGGYTKWMQPMVLDSDASYQRLGLDFAQMAFPELDSRSETRICMTLQVPPILIGTTFGLSRATLANYDVSIRAWWQNVLVPQYKRFSDQIDKDLVPEYGDDVYCKFDFGEVEVLQEERTSRWDRATAAFTAGVISRNDAREEMGLDKLADGGDVFVTAMGATLVPEPEEQPRDPDAASPVTVTDVGQEKKSNLPVADIADDAPPVPTADDVEKARQYLLKLGYKLPAKPAEPVVDITPIEKIATPVVETAAALPVGTAVPQIETITNLPVTSNGNGNHA
jgi:HK97 family phage portal protein